MIQGYRSLLLLAFTVLLFGCTKSDQKTATGKADIRAINAIVSSPNAAFLIEERSLETLAFKSSLATQQFDDLSYTFRFELRLPGENDPRVLARESVDIVRDRDYVFVLDGTVENAEIVLWDTEERQWDGSETVFELGFAHLGDDVGPVDLYFAESGAGAAAGNRIGTLENGDRIDAMEFPEGDYEVILTPPGEPETTLYRSGDRSYGPATTDIVVIFDKDPSVTGDINLRRISSAGVSTELADPRFRPQAQFIHAALGTGNVDFAEDGEFTPPAVSNLAYGERTEDIDVARGATDYTVTAAGNMGAILLEEELTNGAGLHLNRVLTGAPGDLDILGVSSSRRPFSTNPRLAITHAASNFEDLDVYLLPAGETVADNNPGNANVNYKFTSGMTTVESGDYALTLTVTGEKTVLAGPVPIDLAAGDVVETVFLDTADPNVAEILVYRYTP